jgi:ABC-type uncharacterized transport system fused permease/ATPase subunit
VFCTSARRSGSDAEELRPCVRGVALQVSALTKHRSNFGKPPSAFGAEAPWDQTLSGGEKQRRAFARILLHEPDIIVLDEATSALDSVSQDKLMDMLTSKLKSTTIVSVARADATRDSNLQAKFRQIAARYHALAEELDDMAEDEALMLRAQRK